MSGLPILDAELVDADGHPNLFTWLDRGAWARVNTFFGGVARGGAMTGGVIGGELYLAILHLRVLSKKGPDPRTLKEYAERSALINTAFFDPDAYEARSVMHRLAAAISWAMAIAAKQDPDRVSADHKAVAFCLAAPMEGGELAY